MATRNDDVIETTAGEAAAELIRRGVRPEQRVTIVLKEKRFERPRLAVVAARMRATAAAKGLATEVFDDIIAQN
jgi:hypothetical protein